MTSLVRTDTTLGAFCDEIGERFGEIDAIVARDHSSGVPVTTRISYAELQREVHALQLALTDLGIRPGDRVAVLLSSFPEWILYFLAVTRLGAAFVPLNPRFGTSELTHILRHSGSRALVAMGNYLGRDYAALVGEILEDWRPGAPAARLPALETVLAVRNAPHEQALDTSELLERGRTLLSRQGGPQPATDPSSTAILFYTSGTTAFPKGVPLSHANLLPHSVRCGGLLDTQPGERILTLYPFFGISGGANKVLSALGSGATLVFQDAFRAEEAFDLLHEEDCAIVHGVDVQIRELVRIGRERGLSPARERRGTVAFMAGLDESLGAEMGSVLGLTRFIHPYGMTETNPMILRNTLSDPFDASLRPGGRPAEGVEVRLFAEGSHEEPEIGVPGEIAVRGETVMQGYFEDPEANAASFRDGWFLTGDLGVRTEDGFIFYAGRSKDMLKIGGFNVSPQEVEQFLRKHDAIEDVAVTGAPDARLGEVTVAFVKLRPDRQVSEAELQAYCRGKVANFKVPKRIYFVDTLPYHSAAHGAKLQRHVLREWAARTDADERT